MKTHRGAMLILLLAMAGPGWAQLSGTYTCANGNPGSAFDYGSIGAFFDALETQGMSGPVTLNVFDDGGPFVSTASYSLGRNNGGTVADVTGLTAANPLIIRAAPGESPVITGAAAPTRFYATDASQVASISFEGVSYVTLEGFEVTSATGTGIAAYGDTGSAAQPVGPLDNIKISRCKVHGHPSVGICFYAQAGVNLTNCVIENCMVYNVGGNGALVWGSFVHGSIGIRRPHTTTAIRHTTVLMNNGASVSAAVHAKGTGGIVLEYNVLASATSARPILDLDFLPVTSNYNVFHTSGGGTFHPTYASFAAWQAAGQDANGTSGDPMFVSATAPFDLHLQVGSPAIDLATTSTTPLDIDGDARPIGGAPDAGADEVFTGPPPEIEVLQGTTNVNDGGSFVAGNVSVAGVPLTFTIRNTGVGDLMLTGNPRVVLTPGTNCGPGTVVQTQPPLSPIPTNQSTNFTIMLDPAAVGAFSLTISINNNDPDENPFNFTIDGTGVPANATAVASAPGGSMFTGGANGPFTASVPPGGSLANAVINLTDTELDTITVAAITPPAVLPLGISAPAIPAPGHPLNLTWTGLASAANPPGNYTWVLEFSDAGSGQAVFVDVTIAIQNIAPEHQPVLGIGGTGTAPDPYQLAFTESVGSALGIDVASVTDPNTSQAVSLQGPGTQISGPVAVGFQFALAAGVLQTSPAGTLAPADIGVQVWMVTLTDGALTTNVRLSITVSPVPTFSVTTLPAAMEGVSYSQSVTAIGGTGALSITLLNGSLPLGMNLASGIISGTPSVAPSTANFTLTVTDSQGANSSFGFSIQVQVNPALVPTISNAATLPAGQVGVAYTPLNFTATNGTPPYTWSVFSSTLPAGLTLSAAGELGGTPAQAGPFTFNVRVVDSLGKLSTKTFDMTINAAPTPPPSGGTSSGGGGGCTAGGGAFGLALLPAILLWRRRRS